MTDYTWPSSLKPRQMNVIRDYREIPYIGVVSGSRNSIELAGSALRARVGLSLNEAEAERLLGFLGQIRAQDRILMADYRHENSLKVYSGRSIQVRGSVAAGARQINTDGWPNSTPILNPGDRFSINNYLYIVTGTSTLSSTGAGRRNIPVFGPVPASGIADDATVNFDDDALGSWLLMNRPETPSTVGGRIVSELHLLQDVKK